MNCAAVSLDSGLGDIRDQLFCGVLIYRAEAIDKQSEVLEANLSFFQMSGLDPAQVLNHPVDVFAGTGIDEILASVTDGTRESMATRTGTSGPHSLLRRMAGVGRRPG